MEKSKWKVLIADDEQKVCELIQYLVPWESMGLEVEAIVSNGVEAMEVLQKKTVDIIITDARMPECDGIELVKWCHQQKENYKYIIISGYRHFEYAHEALQYGVDYYLLKPINQKDLLKSLEEIVVKLEQETQVQKQRLRDQDRLRRHFIGSYIFDGRQFCSREADSVETINEAYQMCFKEGIYQALFIKVDIFEYVEYKSDKLLLKIQELAEEYLNLYCNEVVGTILHSGVLLVVNYHIQLEETFLGKIEVLYQEVEKVIHVFEGLQLTFGVSCKENSLKKIKHCIVTAVDAIKYRIRLTQTEMIVYENCVYEEIPIEQVFTNERQSLLKAYLESGNHQGIKKLLFDCRAQLRQNKSMSPTMVYYFSQEVSNLAVKLGCDENRLSHFQELVDQARTEESLWNHIETFLLEYLNVIGTELKMERTKPVRLIKEYIDCHFAEEITLEIVAEQAMISANYVSAIFRKETGVTFLDYLTAKRMEKAAELLRKSEVSIGEIAEMVGYTDVKYFSRLCKKMLGMKPSEYRKLYS